MACGCDCGCVPRPSCDLGVRKLGKGSYEFEGGGGAAITSSRTAAIGRTRCSRAQQAAAIEGVWVWVADDGRPSGPKFEVVEKLIARNLGTSGENSSSSFEWYRVIGVNRSGSRTNRPVVEFWSVWQDPVSRRVPAGTPRSHPEPLRQC